MNARIAARVIVRCLCIVALIAPVRAGGQDPESLTGLTVEQLLQSLEWYQTQYAMNGDAPSDFYTKPGMDKYWYALQRDLSGRITSIRDALNARGVRPPGVFVPADPAPGGGGGSTAPGGGGGGSNTQKVVPPKAGGNTQKITPPEGGKGVGAYAAAGTTIFLTAGEMARCATEGVSVADCAKGYVEKAILGLGASLLVGGLIVVFAPGALGATVVAATGIAIASSAGSIFIALDQAASNLERRSQQQANADRINASQMDAIVNTFQQRVDQSRIDRTGVTDAIAGLNVLVEQASDDLVVFRQRNGQSKLASAMCADPQRQPLVYATRADKQLTAMETQSAALVKAVADASGFVTPCSGPDNARRAKEGYAKAEKDLQDLERLGQDASNDVREALRFFASVKEARAAMLEAAKRIARIEQALNRFGEPRTRVVDAMADYAIQLEAHRRAMAGVMVSAQNLRGALPDDPPPHIAAGLKAIDDAYTREASDVLTEERLDIIKSDMADQMSRVEGSLRQARDEYDDLRACGQITGEIPEVLQEDLTRISSGITAAYTTAQQAVANGKGIPAKADECSKDPGGEGRLTGGCQGAIGVTPEAGPVGSPLRVTVTIEPPGDIAVTRVVAENPGCDAPACREMRMTRPGQYVLTLTFQAPPNAAPAGGELGTFRLKVSGFEGDRLVCGGQSKLVTVRAR